MNSKETALHSNGHGSTAHPSGFRILGIDPGLQVTGYAVVEVSPTRPLVREAGVIRSAERRSTTDLATRLAVIYNSIDEVMEQFGVHNMVFSSSASS